MLDEATIQDLLVGIDFVGKEGGHRDLHFAVEGWHRVQTAKCRGSRPEDFAKTDLLMGEVHRLERFWPFREILKNEHPMLQIGNVEPNARTTFGINQPKAIANARAFAFLHNNGLLQQSRWAGSAFKSHLKALLHCPTSLYQIDDYDRAKLPECRKSKFCPYCLSRSAWELSCRLQERLSSSAPLFALIVNEQSHIDWHQLRTPEELATVIKEHRKCANREFRRAANTWQCEGGAIATQILPRLNRFSFQGEELFPLDGTTQLVVRTAMILPVTPTFSQELSRILDNPDPDAVLPSVWAEAATRDRSEPRSSIDSIDLRRSTDSPFRHLVMGTSPGLAREARPDGIRGLLVPAFWSLAPDRLHRLARRALKNWRTFSLFGTWREEAPRSAPSSKFQNSTSAAKGRWTRRVKLEKANDARHAKKMDRIEELFPVVAPAFDEFWVNHRKLPGRQVAKRLIQDKIPNVSDRDVRELVALNKKNRGTNECS